MKRNRTSFALLVALLFLFNVMLVISFKVVTPERLVTDIIYGQTPTFQYRPNQKQTTFFEKYPTEGPTETPVPIPTKSVTSVPGQPSVPTDANGSANICDQGQVNGENCLCRFEGYSDRKNFLCNAPPNNDAIFNYLYTEVPSQSSYLYASYPYKYAGARIGPMTKEEFDAAIADPSCHKTCIEFDKPVIYLYPPEPMYVSVRLDIPGKITKSIPFYPYEGWYVLAYPNGKINYQNHIYESLFYESSVSDIIPRKRTGFLIAKSNLANEMQNVLYRAGLSQKERNDFLDYWLPRLQAQPGPYFFVRLLTHEEKNLSDTVIITPKPDTFIEALFEFYSVANTFSYEPLQQPSIPPERKGFTAVEWGGAIMP